MRLDEVSTGSSTLRFADYIQHLTDGGAPRMIVSNLHGVGVRCLKAGATFELRDSAQPRMMFKHGRVLFPDANPSAYLPDTIELYVDHGEPGEFNPAGILNQGYKDFDTGDAVNFDFGKFFAQIDELEQLALKARAMLEER